MAAGYKVMPTSSKIYLLTSVKSTTSMDKNTHYPLVEQIVKDLESGNHIVGSFAFHHYIMRYVAAERTPVLKENDINFLLKRVRNEVERLTNYLRQAPIDYKHLERWFALMETYCTTPLQKYDIERLKGHFEPFKHPAPQAVATSTQDEVETGTGIDWEKLRTFFKPTFLGIGKGNRFNYFDEYLIRDIPTIKTKQGLAMVALCIHRSEHFNKKTMKFAKWMRLFFEIVGVEPPKNISKSRYEPNEIINQTFRYL